MKNLTFTISGKAVDYVDIFTGERIAGCTCVSSQRYSEARLHIDGTDMKKITYKFIGRNFDIMGFGDGTVIIVHKKIGQIDVKRFDIGRKESRVIKICEVYESVFLNITKTVADLA